MTDKTDTLPGSSLRWAWIAILAAAGLAALEARELGTLIHWERTLPFARDLLPGAIASTAMTLAAFLLIVVLILPRRTRKWALALGIGWGAIVMGASLWELYGPFVKNAWQELLLRVHLTNALIRIEVAASPERRMTEWTAALSALLALGAAKGFADCPRDRLDRGVIMVSIFYASLYYLAMAVVARLVTPH